MKKLIILSFIIALLAVPSHSFAQLKKNANLPNFSGLLTSPSNDMFLGFLDPSKIRMHHSFSMSYGSGGGQGLMLGSYLNTIDFWVSENLFIRTNLGIMTSPYNTFGENYYLNKPQFFGGGEIHYKISDKSSVMLRVDVGPGYYRPGYGYGPYSSYGYPFGSSFNNNFNQQSVFESK
ncbi:MAG TPA: hypothetical protein EYP36_13165 [Calditrichaeota bacterium]|nr:hypothetical protein [Calditrichota bacterium]